ncbi:cytochrome-c oxidase [Paenibacillus terrigena]|uniref:cytochrome-c oxidase n=1 Tax=Paenibacillus terrigena TaxID=369333 RepID=UPI0028D75031|nr:cytochrome-c oxidase [Paenibacillus terrigena]
MGNKMIKVSVIYFFLAICVGVYMGVTHQLQLIPVHTHLNLLGWVSLALAGLIYNQFPACNSSKLATFHFWLHVPGVPLYAIGLAFQAQAFISLGAGISSIGVLCFIINVLINGKPKSQIS